MLFRSSVADSITNMKKNQMAFRIKLLSFIYSWITFNDILIVNTTWNWDIYILTTIHLNNYIGTFQFA